MGRLPLLCVQLIISTMILLYSSILLPLSDAAIVVAFSTKGVDPTHNADVARRITAADSMRGGNQELETAIALDGSLRSGIASLSHNGGSQSQATSESRSDLSLLPHDKPANKVPTVGKLGRNEEEEGASRLGNIRKISVRIGNARFDWVKAEISNEAKPSFRFWAASPSNGDEILQLQELFLSIADISDLGMWQISDSEEDNYRISALARAAISERADRVQNAWVLADIFSLLNVWQGSDDEEEKVHFQARKVLRADVSSAGLGDGGHGQLHVDSGKRNLLADISPSGVWTDAEVMDSQFHKRGLLADISPPGMWSDDGDDTQDNYHKRRLLADISPPGMWQGSDDQLADISQK